MNLPCDDVRDLLALHVEAALDPAEAARVAEHLGSCAACREEERRERAAWQALEALPGAAPPRGFPERVAEAARRSARWRRLVPLAAAASIAIALLVGTLA
ncbi:MAG: zf-HC2 domain-containing protein, partial [Planctomycetota bacterium]